MENIAKKLLGIQAELKVKKNRNNDFGKYKFRNAEDILESLKPFLISTNTVCFCSDEIIFLGNRYYVKATATLQDIETGEKISVSANAREAEIQKGMADPQITGSSSSYARKFALQGLFLLDDSDLDPDNKNNNKTQKQADNTIPQVWIDKINSATDIENLKKISREATDATGKSAVCIRLYNARKKELGL